MNRRRHPSGPPREPQTTHDNIGWNDYPDAPRSEDLLREGLIEFSGRGGSPSSGAASNRQLTLVLGDEPHLCVLREVSVVKCQSWAVPMANIRDSRQEEEERNATGDSHDATNDVATQAEFQH